MSCNYQNVYPTGGQVEPSWDLHHFETPTHSGDSPAFILVRSVPPFCSVYGARNDDERVHAERVRGEAGVVSGGCPPLLQAAGPASRQNAESAWESGAGRKNYSALLKTIMNFLQTAL